MITDMMKRPRTGTLPASPVKTLPLLAVSLLLTCLFTGFVQAADPEICSIAVNGNGTLSFGSCLPENTRNGQVPEAAETAISYINNYLVESGDTATLVNVTEESGMYRVGLVLSGTQKIGTVFVTKDGRYIIPSYYDTTRRPEARTSASSPQMTTTPTKNFTDIKKQDAPVLQAFVVSYCPFGVQMQRVLEDIVTQAPALKKNIEVRYLGEITNGTVQSMHGPQESEENLRQICIREEQGDWYWDYVSCFIGSRSAGTCVESAGVDHDRLNACIGDAGRGLHYAEEDFALASTYDIHGSPTLLLNNEKVSEFDFGGRTPEVIKSMLCAGFTTQPGDCSIAVNGTHTTAGSPGQC